MANFKSEVKIIDKAPKVKVKVETPQENELWVNGLKKKIVHTGDRKGYEIGNYKCVKCGQEQSFDHVPTNFEKWCQCGGRMDLLGTIKPSQVEDIISRQVAFACPKCGKTYRYPVDCCVTKMKLTQGEVLEFNVRRPQWPKLERI